ncbi:MAG: Fic family protein [Thermoleophilaceae bacterium]|nr:Fic family protein [Thermoleophilaceae bacterium]
MVLLWRSIALFDKMTSWWDEPDELERVERALARIDDIDDPVRAAGVLAYRIARAQAFGEGNKRTALLLARWVLDRNGLDGRVLLPPNDWSSLISSSRQRPGSTWKRMSSTCSSHAASDQRPREGRVRRGSAVMRGISDQHSLLTTRPIPCRPIPSSELIRKYVDLDHVTPLTGLSPDAHAMALHLTDKPAPTNCWYKRIRDVEESRADLLNQFAAEPDLRTEGVTQARSLATLSMAVGPELPTS